MNKLESDEAINLNDLVEKMSDEALIILNAVISQIIMDRLSKKKD